MHAKLAEERVWNSALLGEAVEEKFRRKVRARSHSREVARARLQLEADSLRTG